MKLLKIVFYAKSFYITVEGCKNMFLPFKRRKGVNFCMHLKVHLSVAELSVNCNCKFRVCFIVLQSRGVVSVSQQFWCLLVSFGEPVLLSQQLAFQPCPFQEEFQLLLFRQSAQLSKQLFDISLRVLDKDEFEQDLEPVFSFDQHLQW
jgi:hypothetical protein